MGVCSMSPSEKIPPELASLQQTEQQIEAFKRATINTLKAMSYGAERGTERGIENIEINFQNKVPLASKESTRIRLPFPTRPPQDEDIAAVRGAADAAALKLRYHDKKLHQAHQPFLKEARTIYDALEQTRVEALGSRFMEGVAANLDERLHQDFVLQGYTRLNKAEQLPAAVALSLLARKKMTGRPLPADIEPLLQKWEATLLDPSARAALEKLTQSMESQKAFNQATRKLLTAYNLLEAEEDEEKQHDQDEDGQEENQKDTQSADQQSAPAPAADDKNPETETPDMSELMKQLTSPADTPPSEGKTGDGQGEEQPAGPQNDTDAYPQFDHAPDKHTYHAYTTRFDEIVPAQDLCDEGELYALRQQLDQQLVSLQNVVARLANRLQRKLLAKQTRSWNFNQEEGLLDASRLSRIIVNPTLPLSYKMEMEADFRDTVVTLLIDNSGSMRGRPIAVAAICGDLLSRTLERCAVKVEVLGFTTRAWKGGQSRALWLENNKPENPGRLNDLRHIIYKAADEPWRRARRNLGLMLKEGLLKENIDGEALQWATQRLQARPERRKILMMISDGAPVDDSTLAANPPSYLEDHLRSVIDRIENHSNIELIAIGIGHDVTRYYQHAVRISDAEELGGTMLNQLTSLFEKKPAPHVRPDVKQPINLVSADAKREI